MLQPAASSAAMPDRTRCALNERGSGWARTICACMDGRRYPGVRGAAAERLKVMVTRVPSLGLEFTSNSALAFSRQRSRDQRAELAGLGPGRALRQADPVIGDDHTAAIAVDDAVQRDRAAVAAVEGMFERIGQQFVHHQPGRHGDVDRDRIGIDLHVEADALDRVRVHDGRRDLAEIDAEIDLVLRGRSSDSAGRGSPVASTRPASRSRKRFWCGSCALRVSIRISAVIICRLFFTRCCISRSSVSFSRTRSSTAIALAGLAMGRHVDQRHQPEAELAVVVLDDVGIGIDRSPAAWPAPAGTCRRNRPSSTTARSACPCCWCSLRLHRGGPPSAAWASLGGPSGPRASRIPDWHRRCARVRSGLGDGDGDRHLVEEFPELFAFQRIGQIGRSKQGFNLFRRLDIWLLGGGHSSRAPRFP